MLFKARELKPYSVPVTEQELSKGVVYFSVTYIDDDMLIPIMDTLVFIGANLESEDSNKLYFQDVDSYKKGVQFEPAKENDCATFYCCSHDNLNNIFTFENALELLMQCSIRREGGEKVL